MRSALMRLLVSVFIGFRQKDNPRDGPRSVLTPRVVSSVEMDSALQLKQQKQRGKKRKPNKNKVSVRPEKKPRADTSTINATTTTAATTTNPMFRVHWWNNSTSLNPPHQESRGRDLLANLLRINADLFESEYWLKKPYVRHLTPQERKESFSNKSHPVYMLQMSDIDTLLHRKEPNPPRFLNDVDVTRYSAVGDKKEALAEGNPPADPQQVWGAFNEDGYSVRLVHPQQWHQPLFELCSYLQEYFGFPTGCSSYLTPAGSQGSEYYETILNCITGYPAHYDDVEIFVIQLEGKKRWRLYERSDKDTNVSARVTKAFGQEELHKPVADFVMEPGDIMYFPRGTVHQAVSCDGAHSLHVTFSTYQVWRLYQLSKTIRNTRGMISYIIYRIKFFERSLKKRRRRTGGCIRVYHSVSSITYTSEFPKPQLGTG